MFESEQATNTQLRKIQLYFIVLHTTFTTLCNLKQEFSEYSNDKFI